MKKLAEAQHIYTVKEPIQELKKKCFTLFLNPSEIQEVKQILSVIDPNAFASVINVHEVVGDFAPKRGRFKDLKK